MHYLLILPPVQNDSWRTIAVYGQHFLSAIHRQFISLKPVNKVIGWRFNNIVIDTIQLLFENLVNCNIAVTLNIQRWHFLKIPSCSIFKWSNFIRIYCEQKWKPFQMTYNYSHFAMASHAATATMPQPNDDQVPKVKIELLEEDLWKSFHREVSWKCRIHLYFWRDSLNKM